MAKHVRSQHAKRGPLNADILCPSPDVLMELVCAVANGKAVGEYGVHIAIFKAALVDVMRLFELLLAKVYHHVRVPLEWKGGIYNEVWNKSNVGLSYGP